MDDLLKLFKYIYKKYILTDENVVHLFPIKSIQIKSTQIKSYFNVEEIYTFFLLKSKLINCYHSSEIIVCFLFRVICLLRLSF